LLQYCHDLSHHLQRAVQCSLADLHVEPARLTRKQNRTFILSAATPEPTRSAPD
jgi:hypothetical protein